MNAVQVEVMELAKEMGFENWLDGVQTKGWYTCLMTGKKFRGEVAKEMIEVQKRAMAERVSEIAGEAMKAAAESEELTIEPSKSAKQAEMVNKALSAALKPAAPRVGKVADVKIFDKKMEEGSDTLGVLHASGMISRITEKLATHLEVKMVEGKPVKLTTIKCEDCGDEREIKVQDTFQVTRCEGCQKKHRNKKRAERRRQQRAEARASKPE
jgi:hypothetical protein